MTPEAPHVADKPRPPLLLAGPTASGKSEVALLLAEQLKGEIISVDSMQVYRGLDIGTAKPSREEQRRVKHHLIDVVSLEESFDAARFVSLAQRAIDEIQARGNLPILCGGTGFYFKAFLEGLGEAPSSNPALRRALEATALEDLLKELSEQDPKAFEQIDRRNPRRVLRAVEVIRLTGRPFSEQRSPKKAPRNGGEAMCFALEREASDLRGRINVRVDAMFVRGLVAETERLLGQGLEKNATAMQAIGYRQVVEHLRGERSLDETVTLVKQRTWQFARRQMTWLRRQLPVTWVHSGPNEASGEIARRIEQLVPYAAGG